MDLRQLPPALRRELVELQRSFGGRVEIVVPGVALVVRLRLRGAPLTLETDLDTWPDEAPTLTLDAGWFWVHEEARLSSNRKVVGLRTIDGWNRTLGLAAPLRELDSLFRQRPPRRRVRLSRLLADAAAKAFRRVVLRAG